jgi:hypothetical protein
MTTSEERAERLRALTTELRSSVAEVRRASQEARAAIRTVAQTDVTATAEFQRLEREVGESFRSGKSGPAARALQERVDRGELTWRQIREMARVKREVEKADADAERASAERRSMRDDDEQPTILKKRTGRPKDGS